MTLKVDAKLKGKLTRGLKNDLRNLVNFHASLKICTLIGSFCPKYIKFQMRKDKRVMYHDNEE